MKLSSFFNPWYIGPTTFSVWEWDLNRESKMRQIQKKRLAYYQPAIHWWHAQANYSAFVTVVLQPVTGSTRTLLALESTYQEFLEPRLNSPWVHTLLRKVDIHLTKSPLMQQGSLQVSGRRLVCIYDRYCYNFDHALGIGLCVVQCRTCLSTSLQTW